LILEATSDEIIDTVAVARRLVAGTTAGPLGAVAL
jgi:hypothetical protein